MSAKLTAWLFIGLIFASGIMTGVGLTIGTRTLWMHPPNAGQMQRHWIHDLTERLDLTADQQAKIQPILEKAGEQIRGVHHDELDKMTAIFQSVDSQINPILTPDQQQKYVQMERDRPPEFPHHHHDHFGPGDHGPGPDMGLPPQQP